MVFKMVRQTIRIGLDEPSFKEYRDFIKEKNIKWSTLLRVGYSSMSRAEGEKEIKENRCFELTEKLDLGLSKVRVVIGDIQAELCRHEGEIRAISSAVKRMDNEISEILNYIQKQQGVDSSASQGKN